ncbi:unnamed protein product [Lathyrus oleraceus]
MVFVQPGYGLKFRTLPGYTYFWENVLRTYKRSGNIRNFTPYLGLSCFIQLDFMKESSLVRSIESQCLFLPLLQSQKRFLQILE